LVALDANFSLEDLEKFQTFITSSSEITSWWNHLPMVFMLETALSAKEVSAKLHEVAPEARFLVTEVNLEHSAGRLPDMSWKWIERRVPALAD
jgi:hypothetical protein